MPELDDQIRRWTDSASPVSPDEARSAAGTGPAADGPGSSRRWLAVAAVLALLVVGVAVVVTRRGDDASPKRIGSERVDSNGGSTSVVPSTTAPRSDETTSTTTPRRADEQGVPATFVAQDPRHRLLVVDAAAGRIVRVLDTFDDPEAAAPPGEPAGMGRYLGALAVSPDGETVYYETCCEPAVGEVFRVPVDGGEPERVTYGTDPAVSPDGTKLAVIESQALKVVDLESGDEQRYETADNVPAIALENPVWSPDGTRIALERYDSSLADGRVVLVTFDGAEDVLNAASTVAEADDAGSPMRPSFDADGNIHLVRQHVDNRFPLRSNLIVDDGLSSDGEARIEVYDPLGQERLASQPSVLLRSMGFDPTGRSRLEVATDGSVRFWETDPSDPAAAAMERDLGPLRVVDAAW